MIKAVFFDLDGTLLSHKTKQIPSDAVQALLQLQAKGIKIFLSTGRHSLELAQLPVNHIKFDGYITLNGQLCLDSFRQTLWGTPFHPEITRQLVSVFNQRKRPVAFVEKDRIYINFINDTVRKCQKKISTPVPEAGVYNNGFLYQATIFTDSEESLSEFPLPQGCKLARWSENGADIISSTGGKTEGIRYFCKQFHLHPNEIMAFGDADNDIDMLIYSHIGVAMGNAKKSVKAIADYVTADVDKGGIQQALNHFFK